MSARSVEPDSPGGDRAPVPGDGVGTFAERLAATFTQAAIGIAHLDTEGRFLAANPALSRLTGYSEEELRSRTFSDITHPADVASNEALARRLLAGEIPYHRGEKRYVRKDGTPVWAGIHVSLAREPSTGRPFFITIVEDIDDSRRRAAEVALELATKRLRAALTATEVGLWHWDPRTDAVLGDRNLMQLFGLAAPEEVTPVAPYLERIHPADRPRVDASIARALQTGGLYDEVYRVVHPEGGVRWLHARGLVELGEGGKPVSFPGIAVDVTKIFEAAERLRESDERHRAALLALNERLREADRRKDEFIGILAHELRNPLSPVRSAVEILRRIDPVEPRIERARSVIERQVTHMARLIDDLLDVSRIARGKLALQRQSCDLGAIARQTAEDYRASMEESGLRLLVSIPKEPVRVEGDPVRLAQMVANLLHNSARFTEDGGRVEVHVSVEPESRMALITVQDTGVGIPPELLSRLFDPFSQAAQDLARSKGGLGLGLSLTKGLAELHGGGVEARSEGAGHGATFTVRIPLGEERHPAAWKNGTSGGQVTALRVLVVEDNRDAAETLGELLEIEGHEVRLAFDGAEAVRIAHELRPDAVISDIGLPGELDGYSVARALRADPEMQGVRLIALSGYANTEARRRSREAGFDAHLAKPADIQTIERMLSGVARRG